MSEVRVLSLLTPIVSEAEKLPVPVQKVGRDESGGVFLAAAWQLPHADIILNWRNRQTGPKYLEAASLNFFGEIPTHGLHYS